MITLLRRLLAAIECRLPHGLAFRAEDIWFDLLALLALLPSGLRADWEGTNHYELTAIGAKKFWWLELSEITKREANRLR